MKRILLILALLLGTGCVLKNDGSQLLIQGQIAGGTLSCKGNFCCWPWDGYKTVVCVKADASPLTGSNGIIFYIRGKVP